MREKLQQLMNAEQLTASKLAEYLGIQPSSISHILGGRNKPSLDFVQKILQRYPRINPDWLLLDSDEMYRSASPAPSSGDGSQLPFDYADNSGASSLAPTQEQPTTPPAAMPTPSADAHSNPATDAMAMAGNMGAAQHGGVKRVIVLYEDRTFESFEPQR